jgi:hypothetical protein
MLTPGSLARATALLEAHPNVGFAYGRAQTFSGISPPAPRASTERWIIWQGHDWIRGRCRRGRNVIWSAELVMRTSVQRTIGGYRPDLPRSGDLEMWLRAASVSDVGYVRGVDQAFYRVHPDSMTRTIHAGARFQLQAYHDAFATLAESALLPDAEQLYEQARRALAITALRQAYRGYHRAPAEARELTDFARAMLPSADRTVQWRSLQWRRWLLRRWPAGPAPVLAALSYVEHQLHWLWLRWTWM